ncbi:hypothetical protein C8A05DRAFT_17481 [Staphylotrichum tortipilum]|uniref:Uncharacterized protein n=1 Tax=Staphylotrichum tortipilum TaxID=2831512 RepID=A0AAN6MHT5_9PEZI|nr:hypothetical protein C8A05DRAFT_17481 [Staphylotrichum longicolle]
MNGPSAIFASISFLNDNPVFATEKPYISLLPSDGAYPTTNCTFSSRSPTRVVDRRATLSSLSLETDGFVVLSHSLRFPTLGTAVNAPYPPGRLLEYLREVTDVAKEYLGAEKGVCFDWRFRKASPQDSVDGFDDDPIDRSMHIRPAYKAHSDLSPQGGWMSLRAYLSGSEFALVESGEWRARVIK